MKQPDGSYTTQDELFIEAPPGEIYKLLIDFNQRHLWWKSNRAKLLNGGEAKEGSRVAISGRQWIFPIHFLMRIQKLEGEQLIRLEAEEGLIRGICEWQIEPREKGALVRLRWNGVRPKGIAAKLLFALVGDRKHSQHANRGLAGLKAYLDKSLCVE
ncbi:MAG: SRPBCC family protein [Candidatus Omnitrophica bacterium]|nr:SRPBCC family protein [Candidatus Omnitrophota bacterium]